MEDGQIQYQFPAEWEHHACSWLAWPHNSQTWPRNLPGAQIEFERFVRILNDAEPVKLLVADSQKTAVEKRLSGCKNLQLVSYQTNDSWIRDFGPTFVRNPMGNSIAGVTWTYNSWGEKYPPYDLDAAAADWIISHLGLEKIKSKLVMEGGAIETNGSGICLTTRSCLEQRNPKWPIREIKKELTTRLGCPTVVLVEPVAIEGDDTDGHIDQVARFVDKKNIVCCSSQRKQLERMLSLPSNTNHCDAELQLHSLPKPPLIRKFGQTIPASYTNFFIANGIVVSPEFGVSTDSIAANQLREFFPGRTVIGASSIELAVGLGSFHCLSQQQPA